MNIQFFCPRWGSEQLSWDSFCQKVKQAGYDGIEAPIPFEEAEKTEIKTALAKHALLLVGQYYQSFEKDFELHKTNFEKYLKNILSLQPVKIDSQTGKDYFTFEQNRELFTLAENLSKQTGIVIAHETHRNKALFAAHTTKQILEKIPALPITTDFSHWCAVAESLLEDQQEATALACKHAVHIHARVGFAEGPQINDPRAPEWQNELTAHLHWWDAIIQHQKEKGAATMTITPEFGPAPYLPLMPYTQMPVANQWDINVFMMQLLKKRYAEMR